MALEEIVAAYGLVGIIAYAVLGGADFGGGVWDLFALGPRRDAQRMAIAHAMGPVWEANHVWLIFVIVILFTAFPPAYAALSTALFMPFHLVLVGITLRGAAFVFRGPHVTGPTSHAWGTVFGASSALTPVLLGMALAAVSSGHMHVQGAQTSFLESSFWVAPLPLTIGALALALCSYLAAVYLTLETGGALREDFRRRAVGAGTVVVVLATLAIPMIWWEAPHLWQGLLSTRTLPVLALGAAAALVSGWALWHASFQLARVATILHVALLVLDWGLAQFPYVIYPDMTLAAAASPADTLRFVVYAVPAGLVVLLPSLWYLFKVFKGNE